jgi:MoaA/NifB/PqqE/SkfB family radical SAM enzyme
LIQIEVTTRCNYQCFYCAGRDMPQAHMGWDTFRDIVGRIGAGSRQVSLQGEGEPMMHPRFWDMVETLRQLGHRPYTITNGSLLDEPQRLAAAFPTIGVSIDTLDPVLSERIGRYKLPRMLAGFERLVEAMPGARVVVHTVYFGQPLDDLKTWLRSLGITRHIVQPLQSKPDYADRYGTPTPELWGQCSYRCAYLEQQRMRYFDIKGLEMPCCFIKDSRSFVSADRLREELAQRRVPDSCAGCRQLFPQARTSLDPGFAREFFGDATGSPRPG